MSHFRRVAQELPCSKTEGWQGSGFGASAQQLVDRRLAPRNIAEGPAPALHTVTLRAAGTSTFLL